jgi:hypothetical protein
MYTKVDDISFDNILFNEILFNDILFDDILSDDILFDNILLDDFMSRWNHVAPKVCRWWDFAVVQWSLHPPEEQKIRVRTSPGCKIFRLNILMLLFA